MTPRYLLDTNVISEPTRPRPSRRLLRLLAEHESEVAISAVTWHELRFGVARLPRGRRRSALEAYVGSLPQRFAVLAYDRAAADWQARVRAAEAANGRTRPFADGQIAAIAGVQDLVLVTRNTSDFAGMPGLRVESWHD